MRFGAATEEIFLTLTRNHIKEKTVGLNEEFHKSLSQAIDWLKCDICQKETTEEAQCPAKTKRQKCGVRLLRSGTKCDLIHRTGQTGWH